MTTAQATAGLGRLFTAIGGPVALVREDYAQGRIDADEMERQLERALLAEVGRRHPVPDGWEPLEECEHEWIDITNLGDSVSRSICRCGDTRWEL